GKEQNKPEVAPLHIQNPFETSLNVSKNVNATQLDRFVALCQESAWLFQQIETNTPRGLRGNNTSTPWGLASVLLPLNVAGVKSRKKKRHEPASERIKSLLESLKNKNHQKKS
ncbi:poly(A) RNA polymerase, mitochondrial, partial [Lates japonicus]